MTKAKGSGSRERRAFSSEFKMEAVRLMGERQKLGVSLAQIGREVDVRPDQLRRWAQQLEERAGRPPHEAFPGPGPLADEVRRLQRENAVLRQERDFAKKAAAFFARESR